MSLSQLDHIIILIPYALLDSFPKSFTEVFTISPGGRHADNKTENRLVIFRDGVYLELISFIDDSPDLKKGHWWGQLPNGVIDFALTSKEVNDVQAVRDRLKGLDLGFSYAEPRAGGRKRPDGEVLEWKVTFPTLTSGSVIRRGSVPFWCHDITARQLRVPSDDEKATTHPSGALGVKSITVGVPSAKWNDFVKVYGGITGVEGKVEGESKATYAIGSPVDVGKGKGSVALVPFEEEDARVVSLSLYTEKSDVAPIGAKFGEGANAIKIEFVEA